MVPAEYGQKQISSGPSDDALRSAGHPGQAASLHRHAEPNRAQQQNTRRMAEKESPVAKTDSQFPEQVLAAEDAGSTPSEEGNDRATGYIEGWPLLLTTIA